MSVSTDQYPGTDRLTFSNLTEVLRRVVIPRLLDQRGLTRRRSLLSGVLSYRYVDTVPPGSQQLMLASFVKVRFPAGVKCPGYLTLSQMLDVAVINVSPVRYVW